MVISTPLGRIPGRFLCITVIHCMLDVNNCAGNLCVGADCEQLCTDNATATCGCRSGYIAIGNRCIGNYIKSIYTSVSHLIALTMQIITTYIMHDFCLLGVQYCKEIKQSTNTCDFACIIVYIMHLICCFYIVLVCSFYIYT